MEENAGFEILCFCLQYYYYFVSLVMIFEGKNGFLVMILYNTSRRLNHQNTHKKTQRKSWIVNKRTPAGSIKCLHLPEDRSNCINNCHNWEILKRGTSQFLSVTLRSCPRAMDVQGQAALQFDVVSHEWQTPEKSPGRQPTTTRSLLSGRLATHLENRSLEEINAVTHGDHIYTRA